MAVLFFSRALHLDSELVRGWVRAVADTFALTILPARLLLLGPPSPFWSLSISPQQTVEKGQ